MSEIEQNIINYIVEKFGVSENQALTILNDAKNNVPENYQKEVIDFIHKSLSEGGITSLDGVSELVQIKVQDIEKTETAKKNQEEKRVAKEQKIAASYQKDIAEAQKKDTDTSVRDQKISEVIGQSMGDISDKYKSFREKNSKAIEDYYLKSIVCQLIIKELSPEVAKDAVESKKIEVYAKVKTEKICEEIGIDVNSPEGREIKEQVEAEVEIADIKDELEEKIGQKLPDNPKPTKAEYEEIKTIRKRLSQLEKEIEDEQDPSRRVELTRELGKVLTDRLLWHENEMIIMMQRRLEKGIVDQETYDSVVELCNYKKESINKRYDKNRKTLSVDEVVDKQSKIMAELQAGRNSNRYEESTCSEAELILKNCPPGFFEYSDTFFERKVNIFKERIESLENRLKTADGLEKKEIEDDLMFAKRYMKKYESKDFILCTAEMYEEYSKDKMSEILDKTIDSIQKIDEKIAEHPDQDIYKQIKNEIIINFSQSCVESGASSKTMRNFILQKRELSREDRINMALQVQEFAKNTSYKGMERKDVDEYGGLPKALADKINGVRTIACAFIEEADKLLDEKSPEEAHALLEEFRKLEKNNNCNVIFYKSLTKENLDEKFSNIEGIAPENTEFIKTIISRALDSGIAPGKLKFYLKNGIIDHFSEEYAKIAKDTKSQGNLEKFGEKEEPAIEEIPGAEKAIERLDSDIDKERTRRKIAKSHEKTERKRAKQKEAFAEAAKAAEKESNTEPNVDTIQDMPVTEEVTQTGEESPRGATVEENEPKGVSSDQNEVLRQVASGVRIQELTEEFSEIKNALSIVDDKNKKGMAQNNNDTKENNEQDID